MRPLTGPWAAVVAEAEARVARYRAGPLPSDVVAAAALDAFAAWARVRAEAEAIQQGTRQCPTCLGSGSAAVIGLHAVRLHTCSRCRGAGMVVDPRPDPPQGTRDPVPGGGPDPATAPRQALRPLTARQRDAYEAVARSLRARGTPPTLEELCRALGLRSVATAHKLVGSLVEKGWATREHSRSRSLRLVIKDGSCPACGQATREG